MTETMAPLPSETATWLPPDDISMPPPTPEDFMWSSTSSLLLTNAFDEIEAFDIGSFEQLRDEFSNPCTVFLFVMTRSPKRQ